MNYVRVKYFVATVLEPSTNEHDDGGREVKHCPKVHDVVY